jgi:hypothetical protein
MRWCVGRAELLGVAQVEGAQVGHQAVSATPTSVNEQRVRDPATRAQLHQSLRSLPSDRFPTLVALGEHVWVDNRDQRFSAGLQVLVHGLEQALGLTPPNPD